MSGKILTAESVPQYLLDSASKDAGLQKVLEGVTDTSQITVKPILGGNVNYAFCIEFSTDKKPIFLKQAPEFVAIFGPDGYPLTSERMQREMNVYGEWKTMLGSALASKYLPDIYYFDKSHMAVVMEFLDGFELLDHVLVGATAAYHPSVATCLGDFMGQTHAKTHSRQLDAERVAFLTKAFENREMRDIQLEFVFTKCYKEATDEQRAGLTLTPEFMAEVELLKKQYNGDTDQLVLTHGDLHPGSVMVNPQGDTKVIDPEFTVYGPPGLDVGSLLSGYCLGAIHQAHVGNAEAVQRIVAGAQAVWESYVQGMKQNGLDDAELLKAIEIESVGFTIAEVCRTALEFAGGRKWLQFEDEAKKAAAKKSALELVQACMVARHQGGIALLWKELEKAAAVVSK